MPIIKGLPGCIPRNGLFVKLYAGLAGSDPAKCSIHGLCNAHLLRELVFLHEEQGQQWAKKVIACLIKIKEVVEETRLHADRLSAGQLRRFEMRYRRIVGMGRAEIHMHWMQW